MDQSPTADALDLVDLFETFGPLYRRLVGQGLPEGLDRLPDGISPARLRLMSILAESGPKSMVELRLALGATAQTITGLVDALEADGMITRGAHHSDRRKIVVSMSPEIQARVLRERHEHRKRVAAIFDKLDASDRHALRVTIEKLVSLMKS